MKIVKFIGGGVIIMEQEIIKEILEIGLLTNLTSLKLGDNELTGEI